MNPLKGTFTVEPVVTIQLEGFEPLPEMRKKSEWHGMWELRSPRNEVLIIALKPGGGFLDAFAHIFGERLDGKPVEFTIISASPALLVPLKKAEA